MAPAKRGRPAFSPPRPGKSKTQSEVIHVSTAMAGREAKWKNGKNAAMAKKRALSVSAKKTPASARKRGRPSKERNEEDEEEDSDDDSGNGRSALALVDMQAGVDGDDDDESEEQAENNGEDFLEEDSRISNTHNRGNQNDSLEPDMMLAEITTTNEPSTSAIPEKLVHRLLAHHFEKGEKTKISTDARDLVSKYLEVFIREAIMRSAFEKDERQTADGGAGGGGFLEVEDLERAAVQLCLDF